MKKIKNVIIINDFNYTQGGASKVAIDTANLLCQNYPDLNVYFFSGCCSDKKELNTKIIDVCVNQEEVLKDKNKIRGILNGIYNLKAKNKLKELLNTLNVEDTIIHIHGWTKCLSSSVFDIAFKMNFKLVLTTHDYFTACPNGGYFNYKKNEICHFKPLSLKCIKCNCDSRNYAFKLYRVVRQLVQNRVLNKKLVNIISISQFSEDILRKTIGKNVIINRIYNPIDMDDEIINPTITANNYYLFVGRVSKEKGADIFCKAISELKLKGIVVGDGSEKDNLQNQYPEIEFVGWKNKEEVKKYILGAKMLIFPSKIYEGAPLVPLEAMQYGIPCIVSDCCAAANYICEGKNGFTFNGIDDLKKKIQLSYDIKWHIDFDRKLYDKNIYCFNVNNVYESILRNK